ncbi:hypothetical protein GCM10023196_023690 [Actinoallomurus vinaceus]|uniref:AMP-dependent synthetase/ligase domain-containing protein n=1 Tax=Actinoallomurus vinaceus TaxID=1080074 RepID=A0ABP8UA44_9ACTN
MGEVRPAAADAAVVRAAETFAGGDRRHRPAVERAAVLRAAADHIERLGDAAVMVAAITPWNGPLSAYLLAAFAGLRVGDPFDPTPKSAR